MKHAKLIAALSLSAFVVFLHIWRATHAGALWRDEAASVQLAALPSWSEVVRYYPHEAFPLLFSAIVRGYNQISGGSDVAWRIFGAFVGISIVAALWLNAILLRRGSPLLSVALLGLNADFVKWGDSIRGYGLGTAAVLCTIPLVWRLVERPTKLRFAFAALAAVCSVQLLFQNAALILAMCVGAIAVALRAGERRSAANVLGVGIAAAISLLPYWSSLQQAREWDMMIHWPMTFGRFVAGLDRALSFSWAACGWIWLLIFLSVLGFSLVSELKGKGTPHLLLRQKHFGGQAGPFPFERRAGESTADPEGIESSGSPRENVRVREDDLSSAAEESGPDSQFGDKQILMFAALTLIVGVIGYYGFLQAVSHPPQPWHYVALLGFAAMLLDLGANAATSVTPVRWAVGGQIAVALLVVVFSVFGTWTAVGTRQSNMDAVAQTIARSADSKDLIIVSPWYMGISFNRYYHGAAHWMTIPPIDGHEFHRYDQVRDMMTVTNQVAPIEPVVDAMVRALQNGGRVWTVGIGRLLSRHETPVLLPPAPTQEFGWGESPYTAAWTGYMLRYIQATATHVEDVSTGLTQRVNRVEDLPVKVFSKKR